MRQKKSVKPKRTILDLRTFRPHHQFDYYRDEVGRRYARFERERLYPAKDFPALIRAFDYGPLHVTLVQCPLLAGRRTQSHVRADDRQDYFLKLVVSGALVIKAGDSQHRVDAGNCYIANYSEPHSFETILSNGNFGTLTLRLPAKNLPSSGSAKYRHFNQRFQHHKMSPLLKMSLTHLVASMKGDNDQETAQLTDVAQSIVALILNDDTFRSFPADNAQQFEILDAEISRRVGDTTLNLQSVARQLGTSIRHIQRLMANHQTSFSNFLREKRLMLAMNRLRDKAYARESIEEIAYSCGFNELSAFYRAFRKMFYCTPGDARRDSAIPGNPLSEIQMN